MSDSNASSAARPAASATEKTTHATQSRDISPPVARATAAALLNARRACATSRASSSPAITSSVAGSIAITPARWVRPSRVAA